eukprot:COSAG06_NODE_12675_length_1343_cov_93.081994_1_plen_162_part_00
MASLPPPPAPPAPPLSGLLPVRRGGVQLLQNNASLFPQRFLCLSRACLGSMVSFSSYLKTGSKQAVSAPMQRMQEMSFAQDKTRQDKARQDKARQDKARHGTARQGKTTQDAQHSGSDRADASDPQRRRQRSVRVDSSRHSLSEAGWAYSYDGDTCALGAH